MSVFKLILIVVLVSSLCQMTSADMICKDIKDLCQPEQLVTQGRSGKRGSPGETGPPGPRGPKGVVDYDAVRTMIGNIVGENLNNRLAEIKQGIAELKTNQEELKNESLKGFCQVRNAGVCYWLIVRQPFDINYAKAKRLCEIAGAKLAVVPNEEVYESLAIIAHGIGLHHNEGRFNFWIDMTYNFQESIAYYSNGTQAKYLKWYPGYPDATSTYTNVMIQFKTSPNINEGMFNYPHTYASNGAICQI